MRNKINRGTNKNRGAVPFFKLHSPFFIFLLIFILGFSTAFAQEAERITVDGSSLRAGESFNFTVTVNSDEMQSFADAQSRLTAVLCPQGESTGSCQTLSMNVEGEDNTVMRVVFTADALPAAGDYTLDVSFTDLTGAFAQQNAAYLITGVREAESQPTAVPTDALPTATPETLIQPEEPTTVPTETVPTATPESVPTEEIPTETAPTEETTEPQLPTVTINVTLIPTIRDEADNNLIYGSTMYVGETYLLQIASDSPMNDSVTVEAAFPSYLTSAALDPTSGCLEYLNAEGTGLSIPGSRWNAENGNTFRCELRFMDSTWLNANPVNFTISATGTNADETYELAAPLSWNYYPVNVGKYAATHQVQISDSRGNLICSDTVPCSAFNSDEIYTFTYKFPSDWGAAMPSGKSFNADILWPADWGMAFQASNDWETASEFGAVCEVDADGMTHLSLQETSEGRYSASCTFAPSAISNPVQAPALVHLNNNSYQLTDLNVYMPGTIIKQKAALTPSLTMQVLEDSDAAEQIQNGTISTLYRTTVDMPNNGGGYGMPALYTLRAQIDGISAARSPQWNDHVRVTWPVLDALAAAGDLPSCLVPEGSGYTLGTLFETGEGTWEAECSFRFPVSLSPSVNGGTLQMELLSGLYSTTAAVGTSAQPFEKKALTVNLDVPGKMVLNHPMELRAYMTDETGGLSDYTRAVLNQAGAALQSDWAYNYATTCQGSYDLSENGESVCEVEFNAPTDADSTMHFELASGALSELFNVSFRPAADIYVAQINKMDVTLTPSLALQISPDSGESEQINSGWINRLYRTAADMPNIYSDSSNPARYTLRAQISGVYADSTPQFDDYVLVNWNVLDLLSQSGDLPTCLMPTADGYRMDTLEQSGEQTWTASCSFYFPRTAPADFSGGALSMQLVSSSYQGSASAQMNGSAFQNDNLYIDISVPDAFVLNQEMEIKARMYDDTGSLSDYARAVIAQTGASLQSDWAYNYASLCQGVYDLSSGGEASCMIEFNTPTEAESTMHFELASPALSELFNVSFRPSADISVARVNKIDVSLTPSLALQISPDSGESEQINSGWISQLYRTAADMPNAIDDSSNPARYTLRAQVNGVYAGSTPEFDDYVLVNWNVLDLLSQSGDLPTCLMPTAEGYRMDTLEQSGEQTWTASCSFYFPRTAPADFSGGALSMQLVSSSYQGSASAQMNGSAFHHDNLYIDISVPGAIVLDQDMEIKARMYDDTGSFSDYARAVIAQTGASLQSDWVYNDVTDCLGFYDLSGSGEASCGFRFYAATDMDSNMHFDLTAPGLSELFNVSYRPGADIHVAKISKMNVTLAPSLTMRMTPGSDGAEQISGGWIGRLYRTAGDMPNVSMSDDLPARYTLRANISGLYNTSQPQPGDYVLVNWPLLDALSYSGNLPSCISPAADGYMLGTLETNGESSWTASCDFYFPQTLDENLTGTLMMQLVAGAYEGSASAQMNGGAFSRGNLYVDLDIPEHMLIRQMSEMRVRVSDDSGGLSEYSRLMLDAAGATLRSDWEYNYVTTCQGLYDLDWDGNSTCSALFEAPTMGDSMMHFELVSPALENLFNVSYRPSSDIHIAEVSNPSAVLSVKLFHAGNEIPLPAFSDETFHVGEAYQLQFYLTPDPEFRDVLNAVAVDNEGLVIDWWEPLRLHWGMLPGGETSLNFYRDGDHFIARYDFSFDQGDVNLDGILGQLVTECWIENWDITGINNMEPVQLPAHIDKRPVSLELGNFVINSEMETQSDVYVNQTAEFTVKFNGSLDYFDANQMIIGYDANGIRTPIDCFPDLESGVLTCSFIPVCTDLNFDGTYPGVCGTGLSLYAEYNGDSFNEAAAVSPKAFNVKRADLRFYPAQEGSLSEFDLYHIQQALPDLSDYADSGLRVGTWTVDGFLPREIRSDSGSEFKSYPVVFRYNKSGDDPLDETQLRLDVHYQTGEFLNPIDETISLKPVSVTDDTVTFDLDFGSMEMLDDGRLVQDALRNAVTITSLEVSYPGSQFIAPSSARYEAENLTFALKVATVLDMDLDVSMPGVLHFGGAAAAEMMTNPFNVYCSQLYQEIQCSAELPLDVQNDNGEPLLSEIVEDGCWGKIQTKTGSPEIYVNNSVFPQCYLSTVDFNGALMIAGEF